MANGQIPMATVPSCLMKIDFDERVRREFIVTSSLESRIFFTPFKIQ
jgi:hypothetical protein